MLSVLPERHSKRPELLDNPSEKPLDASEVIRVNVVSAAAS